ncbi:MAG: hydrolase [Parachlamydia sp.]|nr:hydrolase [Parachlamydia sp.]
MNLNWIASQQPAMENLLEQWVNINSFTGNLQGLSQMASALQAACEPLQAQMELVSLPDRAIVDQTGRLAAQPLGKALHLVKRPSASYRLFLGGHMDTVYPPDSLFQKAERKGSRLYGPGSADMKGGLVILLTLLQALEQSPLAKKIGWEVVINPDEEIGSVGSRSLLTQCAARNHLGLIFEPSFADGSIASSRKGSASFTIVVHGRAAHSGRDFASGRNAITALSRIILKAEMLTDLTRGTSVNVGIIQGGQAVNIIPDLATCRLNVRFVEDEALAIVQTQLQQIIREQEQEGLSFLLHEDSANPPKPFDEKQKALFQILKMCGEKLNQSIQWQPSGGACDGNNLQAHGLRTIDALGVIGGGLHTPDEYADLSSLSERAQLVALFIEQLVQAAAPGA